MKSNCINHVLELFNSFHSNIKFTTEIQKEKKIAFLDILLIHYKDLTTVYFKKRNTDLCINWKSFSPNSRKWGTLNTLVSRAFGIYSTEIYLKQGRSYRVAKWAKPAYEILVAKPCPFIAALKWELHFKTNSKLRILSIKSRELYSVT